VQRLPRLLDELLACGGRAHLGGAIEHVA
jgi:hypothetical protein